MINGPLATENTRCKILFFFSAFLIINTQGFTAHANQYMSLEDGTNGAHGQSNHTEVEHGSANADEPVLIREKDTKHLIDIPLLAPLSIDS